MCLLTTLGGGGVAEFFAEWVGDAEVVFSMGLVVSPSSEVVPLSSWGEGV